MTKAKLTREKKMYNFIMIFDFMFTGILQKRSKKSKEVGRLATYALLEQKVLNYREETGQRKGSLGLWGGHVVGK